jgi:hypothetical protein
MKVARTPLVILGVAAAMAFVPRLGLPAFYDSLLYLMLHWIVLATSWNILSGYTGYFSFGHGAFFGAGIYTTSTLLARFEWPFLWTLPVAAAVAAVLGVALGAVVFRVRSVRGELFALLTLAITFVVGTIVGNTPIDGGQGVSLTAVPVPRIGPTPSSTFYLLALAAATLTLLVAWAIYVSRFGAGCSRSTTTRTRRGDGRADLPLQARRARDLVRARRHRGRHPRALPLVRHRRRGVHDHGAAHGCADERARRNAPLGRAGDRRGRDHRAALQLHRRRQRGRRQGCDRRDPDRRDPVHADGILPRCSARSGAACRRARRSSTQPSAPPRRCSRRAGPTRDAPRRGRPARHRSAQAGSRACARSPASQSRCGAARSSACSGRTARASPTFINVVSGHYAPSAGEIVFEGPRARSAAPRTASLPPNRAHVPDPAPVRAHERAR